MRLEEIADIIQGIPLSRIRVKKEEKIEKRLVYSFEKQENEVVIPKNTDQEIPLVEKDTILFNLVSYRARKAIEVDVGKVLSSNYVIIKVKTDKICPDYLAWYMDKGESFKRELEKLKQGTTVMSLPINEIRRMKLKLPSIDIQKKLGKLSSLNRKKEDLFLEKQELIKRAMISINEEAINNG